MTPAEAIAFLGRTIIRAGNAMLASVRATWPTLTEHHYLGPTKTARFAWKDEFGVMDSFGPEETGPHFVCGRWEGATP